MSTFTTVQTDLEVAVVDQDGLQAAILQQQSETFKLISESLTTSILSMEEKFSEKLTSMEGRFLKQTRRKAKSGLGTKMGTKSGKSGEVSDLGQLTGPSKNVHAESEETSGLGQHGKSIEPPAKKRKVAPEEFEYDKSEGVSDFSSDEEEDDSEASDPETFEKPHSIDDFLHTKSIEEKEGIGENDVYQQALLDLVEEEYGSDIDPGLQKVLEKIWRSTLKKAKIKLLVKGIIRPQNCDFLATQMINQEMFFNLKDYAQKRDIAAQRSQKLIAKAATPLVESMDILKGIKAGEALSAETITGLKKRALDSFSVLGVMNTLKVKSRKEDALYSLGKGFRKFKEPNDQRSSEFLFEEKSVKKMKTELAEIDKKSHVEHKQVSHSYQTGMKSNWRGNSRGSYRGRGQSQSFSQQN